MGLPFLKNKEGAVSAPVEVEVRTPDEGAEDLDVMEYIAGDLMQALDTKDVKLLKEVLSALVEHIRDLDEEQDEQS